MVIVREWYRVIADGGCNGLLMGGALIVAAMFVFAFIGNRWFWLAVTVAVVAWLGYLGYGQRIAT